MKFRVFAGKLGERAEKSFTLESTLNFIEGGIHIMGEYKDRNDLIYDKLIERLDEEGYDCSKLETFINNKIVDLIRDAQLDDFREFEQLVKEAIDIINKNTYN